MLPTYNLEISQIEFGFPFCTKNLAVILANTRYLIGRSSLYCNFQSSKKTKSLKNVICLRMFNRIIYKEMCEIFKLKMNSRIEVRKDVKLLEFFESDTS